MNWFKKHTDAFMIIAAIIGAMIWMNTKFNEVDKKFSEIERELAIIKTVMIMKGIMPVELAMNNVKEHINGG